MLTQLCNWISTTQACQVISGNLWMIPLIQSIHIIAVTVVMAPMLMFDLRLMGVAGRKQPIWAVANRFVPPIWYALLVLLGTGILLVIGEPDRELLSPTFQVKMILVATVSLITYFLYRKVQGDKTYWDSHRATAIVLGVLCLCMWISILTAGRLIAYMPHGGIQD